MDPFTFENGRDLYAPAWRVAREAWTRANLPAHLRDEDAVQEAALGLFAAAGRPKSQAFRRARWAVLAYIFEYVREDRSHRPGAHERGEVVRVTRISPDGEAGEELTERACTDRATATLDRGPEDILIAREETAVRERLIAAAAPILYEAFLQSRKRGGARAVRAAVRDTNLILLRWQGYEDEGIAHELGIPRKDISYYTRLAVERLGAVLASNFNPSVSISKGEK